MSLSVEIRRAAANISSLPKFDGELQGGLSGGTDFSLPVSERVPLLNEPAGNVDIERKSVLAAAITYAEKSALGSTYLRELYTSVAAAIQYFGLYGYQNEKSGDVEVATTKIDGDWRPITADDLTKIIDVDSIKDVLTEKNLNTALTIIFSGKLNYWLTNHHVGSRSDPSQFIRKVIATLGLTDSSSISIEEATNLIHTGSHWASTREVLRRTGIRNILGITCPVADYSKREDLLSSDFKLRMSSAPAGTAMVHICHKAFELIIQHQLGPVCPAIPRMAGVSNLYHQIMEEPAFYHEGAHYLTGEAKRGIAIDSCIGVVGSFLVNLRPSHSLSKSPKIVNRGNKVYQSAEDYDSVWEQICATAATTMIKLDLGIIPAIFGQANASTYTQANLDAAYKSIFPRKAPDSHIKTMWNGVISGVAQYQATQSTTPPSAPPQGPSTAP